MRRLWILAGLPLFVVSGAQGDTPALFSENGAAPVPVQQTPEGVFGQSARACAGCHSVIYEEWESSMHSAAWNDPLFQEFWRATGREESCSNCHSPMQVQQPLRDGRPNPLFQPTLQSEGVTCAACHIRDGMILGSGTSTGTPPHPVRVIEGFGEVTTCASCHQSAIPGRSKGLYDTVREWESADSHQQGGGCLDCHMPRRTGNVSTSVHRSYRSHEFLGSHSDAMLRRSLTVNVELSQPLVAAGERVEAVVSVQNTGAGHHVPSGDPMHQISLTVGLAGSRGEFLDKKQVFFARDMARTPPYVEKGDTRLAAGEIRRISFGTEFPGGLGEHYLIVQLSYHLVPATVAEQLGLPEEVTTRVFDSQVIPILVR